MCVSFVNSRRWARIPPWYLQDACQALQHLFGPQIAAKQAMQAVPYLYRCTSC